MASGRRRHPRHRRALARRTALHSCHSRAANRTRGLPAPLWPLHRRCREGLMPQPFEPIGAKARWRIVYDLLLRKQVDDRVTYVELGTLLDLDPDDERHTIQMSMRRAAQEYEREGKRALESVPNVGYRIVHA